MLWSITTSAMDEDDQPSIILTKTLRGHIQTILEDKKTKEGFQKELTRYVDSDIIPFSLVKQAFEILSQSGCPQIYLHEMIQGSELVLPEYVQPPRDPELESRCQKLRAQQDNKKYQQMVSNISRKEQEASIKGVGSELKELNRQLITVFNFVLTVAGAFAFTYKATEYTFASFGDTFGLQLIAGLTVATVVFFADLYFLMKYDSD